MTMTTKANIISPSTFAGPSLTKVSEKGDECVVQVPNLPPEMLSTIFRTLGIAERKACRLVCRTWYIWLCSLFDKEERICIDGAYCDRVKELTSIFARSSRTCFCFEFHGIKFKKIFPNAFWEECGPRTISIKLIDCKVSAPVFASILKHCSSLKVLGILRKKLEVAKYNPDDPYADKYKDALYKIGLQHSSFNKIIPDTLQNYSLRTLEIGFVEYIPAFRYSADSFFWLDMLDRLFHFFPNISNFSLCHFNLHAMRGPEIHGTEEEYRNAKKHLSSLFMKNTVKNIAMNFLSFCKFDWRVLRNLQGLTKMTELSIDVKKMSLKTSKLFIEFALRQTNLKKITCISNERVHLEEDHIDHLMSFPSKIASLRALQLLIYGCRISWKDEWSKSLGSSSLDSLKIACFNISFSTSSKFILNSKITTFAVHVVHWIDGIIPFLKSLPNLKDLHLSHVYDLTLQAICMNQTELRSLSMENMQCSPSTANLMHQLKKLEKLKIPPTMGLSNHYKYLKRLRYLHVSENIAELLGDPNISVLQEAAKCPIFNLYSFKVLSLCTSLEAICIDYPLFPQDSGDMQFRMQFVRLLFEFVCTMKYLKFLSFGKHKNGIYKEDVLKIFKLCPSLRVLTQGITFVRDPITGSVNKLERTFENGSSRIPLLRQFFTNIDDEWIHQQYVFQGYSNL